MKVAFDAHIPPVMVDVCVTMQSASPSKFGCEFCSALDYELPEDEGDVPWLTRFAKDGGTVVVSGDKAMRNKPHERQAFMDAGLIMFFFHRSWNHFDFSGKTSFLLKWWPRIEIHAQSAPSPSCWQIPRGWESGEFQNQTPSENAVHGRRKKRR